FLTLTFDHQKAPWKMASSFDWNDQKRLTVSHLRVDAMRSHIEGEMSCLTSDLIWEGFLEARIGNLNEISHFLTPPVSGEGQFKIQLAAVADSNHKKRQGFQIEFMGQSLHWMEWQAQQLTINLYTDPRKEEGDFFQVQT